MAYASDGAPAAYSGYHYLQPTSSQLITYAEPYYYQQPAPALAALPRRTGSGTVAHPDPRMQHIVTLFVAGLPDNVRPREIYNLFSRLPGFDSFQLEFGGRRNHVVAFVVFYDHLSAMAALKALNGVIFDPETNATLHIDLAKSNSRKRPRGNENYKVIHKRTRGVNEHNDEDDPCNDDGDGGSDEPSGTDNDKPSNGTPLTTVPSAVMQHKKDKPAPATVGPDKSSTDVPPCSTLFIANLGPSCTETELTDLISKYPGFKTLKLRKSRDAAVAFADFMDIDSSTAAMQGLQGIALASSNNLAMHVEYARSRMKKHS